MTTFKPVFNAMNSVAASACQYCVKRTFCLISMLVLATGCSVIDKPTRATMYDFGRGDIA